jgi:hypothetical protein
MAKRGIMTGMARTILIGLGVAAALAAGGVSANDLAARAVRERQAQSDAFALQLQQSIQSFRAGNLPPQQRLELESIHRDQRFRQDEILYRQEVDANSPNPPALRRAEAMRADQERQQQLLRFRAEAVPGAGGGPVAQPPLRLLEPTVAPAPVPRGLPPEPDPATVGP